LPRAYWNGFLKLLRALTRSIRRAATRSAKTGKVSFRQVSRRTGRRLRHQLVDSITGATVVAGLSATGQETSRFLLVEDRELEQARSESQRPGALRLAGPPGSAPAPAPVRAAEPDEGEDEDQGREEDAEENDQEEAHLVRRPKNTRTIEIERFVLPGQVDVRYFEKPYYVVPRDAIGQEAFAVIRDARAVRMSRALPAWCCQRASARCWIAPMGNGLCGVTLRFAMRCAGKRSISAGYRR
jgi:DNA end-binding protein Ku